MATLWHENVVLGKGEGAKIASDAAPSLVIPAKAGTQ